MDEDSYLVEVSRYVHLNPVRAGLAARPWDWKWSSCIDYADARSEHKWMNRDVVLEYFGKTRSRAIVKYRESLLAAAAPAGDKKNIMEEVIAQVILGDDNFVEKYRKLMKGEGPVRAGVPSERALRKWKKKESDEALFRVASYFGATEKKTENKTEQGLPRPRGGNLYFLQAQLVDHEGNRKGIQHQREWSEQDSGFLGELAHVNSLIEA